jgi:secreted trypsin-like serine protease
MVKFEVRFALFAAIFVAVTNCQQITRRIINGIEVNIRFLPWVVAFTDEYFYLVGSGCIVSEKWVLTAGHLWDESLQ